MIAAHSSVVQALVRRASFLALMGVLAAACGGGGSTMPTSPSSPSSPTQPPPPPPSPSPSQPPTVHINGAWTGTFTRDGGSGTLTWTFFAQDGNSITGTVLVAEDMQRDGALSGTLSGNTLTFTFTFGVNCTRTVTGTATFDAASASGTFSGQDCNGVRINNGRLSLSIQRGNPSALAGTTWYPAANGPSGGLFGFDGWGWRFTQVGTAVGGSADASGSAMVCSSAVVTNCHSQGPLTGTLAYQGFDYVEGTNTLRHWWRLTSTATLSGRCPSTLNGTTNRFGVMGAQMTGTLNGSTCTGPVNNVSFQLPRQ